MLCVIQPLKFFNDLIELTEDTILEGYDEYGDVYTFAGATPAEILNEVNTELNFCIESCVNTLTRNVLLIGEYMLCAATSSEIADLSG